MQSLKRRPRIFILRLKDNTRQEAIHYFECWILNVELIKVVNAIQGNTSVAC